MIRARFNDAGFAVHPLYVRKKDSPVMLSEYFKIDTGANCTTISKDWLAELGYDESWIRSGKRLTGSARPTVVSGLPLDDCYEVVLPEITLGDWVGYNWPMVTSLSANFRFLLGTDSMQFFNWRFDYGSGFFGFELVPGKRRVLFDKSEQTIHAVDDAVAGG